MPSASAAAKPAMARDQHAILVHQQRVGEAEGLHAGHDPRELRRVMHARLPACGRSEAIARR